MHPDETPDVQQTIICPNCAHINPAWSDACAECHTQLGLIEATQAAKKHSRPDHPERPGCVTALALLFGLAGLALLVLLVVRIYRLLTAGGLNLLVLIPPGLLLAAAGFSLWLANGLLQQRRKARTAVLSISMLGVIGAALNSQTLFFAPFPNYEPLQQVRLLSAALVIGFGVLLIWFGRNRSIFWRV